MERNKPLTQTDLDGFEGLLLEASGMNNVDEYREKMLEGKPIGISIREHIGLDMNAAKEAFSDFLDEGIYSTEHKRSLFYKKSRLSKGLSNRLLSRLNFSSARSAWFCFCAILIYLALLLISRLVVSMLR